MTEFSRAEVEQAFEHYMEVQQARDWPKLADVFTDDAVYEEAHFGTFRGRGEIREFLAKSMADLSDWTFPTQWVVIDGSRVVFKWWNRLPGERAACGEFPLPLFDGLRHGLGFHRKELREMVFNRPGNDAQSLESRQLLRDLQVELFARRGFLPLHRSIVVHAASRYHPPSWGQAKSYFSTVRRVRVKRRSP